MNLFLEKFKEVPRGVSPRAVLTIEWVTAVQDMLRALAQGENIGVEGGVQKQWADARVVLGQKRGFKPWGKAAVCPFGNLITLPAVAPATVGVQAIRGGVILCGDKNFNVPDGEINVGADGPKVIYITIPCEANMDDDSELILSGIKTSSAASLTGADWTVADSYPDNTNPTVASAGIGTFIFPIGSITITSGAASNFVPTGCGTCNISQCAGTLSHTRG